MGTRVEVGFLIFKLQEDTEYKICNMYYENDILIFIGSIISFLIIRGQALKV